MLNTRAKVVSENSADFRSSASKLLPNFGAKKLTKQVVDAATPDSAERFLWDTELRGFGLRVSPAGRRTFMVQYRARGRTRRVKIGSYPKMTPEQARKQAWNLLNAVEQGGDPAESRAIDREALTMREFIESIYLPEATQGLVTYRGKAKRASTLFTDKSRIDRHIIPLLGHRKVRDLRPGDIADFINDVATGKTAVDVKTKLRGRAIVTGGSGTARRTAGLLGGILSHAVTRRIIEANPVRGVDKRFADRRRNRILSPEEYRSLGQALADSNTAHDSAIAAIRFLALSGFRKGEALGLQHSNIDAGRGCIRLEDSKTGPQVRPVGRAALKVLARPKGGRVDLIFWGTTDDRPFLGLPKAFERMCARAGISEVSLHTLRHSFATVAAELGYSEFVIAGLLGHRVGGVTHRYTHLPDQALVGAANAVADEIDRRMRRRKT